MTVRLLGDVNGDGQVAGTDKLAMEKALNQIPTGLDNRFFDLNGDGANPPTGSDKLILNKVPNGLPIP